MTDSPQSLPFPDSFRPRGSVRPSRRARWRALSLVAVHAAIAAHVAHWWFAGESLTPLEPSESMETLELGVVNAGFLLFAVAILATLLFGRFFCGWACHVVAYQDLSAWLLARVGLKPRPVRSRLLAFVPLGAALYMFVWPSVRRAWAGTPPPELRVELVAGGFWDTFPGPVMSVLTFLVVGFLMVWWLGGKGFCFYGCPYGGLFGVVDRASPTRIRVTDACEQCGHCTSTCTSNVRVHEEVARYGMVVDTGCMKCLDCVSVCPKDALYLGPGRPALGARARGTAPRATRPAADFGWGEEVLLVVGLALGLFAFRGLYGAVPFLLALGLAVLTAAALVTALRLVRARTGLALQHAVLRGADGSWRGHGLAAAALLALWFGFAAHSSYVQFHEWRGREVARHAYEAERGSAARSERFARSLAHFESAEAAGLVPDARLPLGRGLVLRELGRYDDAGAALDRALALRPDWPEAAVARSDLLAMRGAWDEAENLLRAVERRHGDLPDVRRRLQTLERRR